MRGYDLPCLSLNAFDMRGVTQLAGQCPLASPRFAAPKFFDVLETFV
jgi:hypothetical protein